MAVYTLRKLLELHPEWADLPITICKEDGDLDFVGDEYEKGGVREGEYGTEIDFNNGDEIEGTGEKILVFWS